MGLDRKMRPCVAYRLAPIGKVGDHEKNELAPCFFDWASLAKTLAVSESAVRAAAPCDPPIATMVRSNKMGSRRQSREGRHTAGLLVQRRAVRRSEALVVSVISSELKDKLVSRGMYRKLYRR